MYDALAILVQHVSTVSELVGMVKATHGSLGLSLESRVNKLMRFLEDAVTEPTSSVEERDRDDEFFENNENTFEVEVEHMDDIEPEPECNVEFDEHIDINLLTDMGMQNAKVVTSSMGEPSDSVTVSFNDDGRFVVTNHDDDSTRDVDASYVLRTGKKLKVGQGEDDVLWHEFDVSKFGKGWTSVLNAGLMYKVVA